MIAPPIQYLIPRCAHRFWTILGGILAGFIVLKQLFQGFHLWDSVQAELLEIAGQASSPGRACSRRAAEVHVDSVCTFWLLWMMWSIAPLKPSAMRHRWR